MHKIGKSIIVFVIVFVAAWNASEAVPLQICYDRKVAVERLKAKHDEVFVSSGLTANGQLLEIFVSPAGTWTVLLSYPVGISCIFASGTNWRSPLPQYLIRF